MLKKNDIVKIPMDVNFRKIKESDEEAVSRLMKSFAKEDAEYKNISDENINKTFNELEKHPEKGSVMVFEDGDDIVGYSILINFWSNEYGGNVLDIDELYVRPDHRGKGIGTDFIKYLISNKFNDCVAIDLETMPSNKKAMRFYENIGFKVSPNKHFIYDL